MGHSGSKIIIEGLAVVAVLFPIHFFTERPRATVLSTALALLLFFVPPVVAAVRLEPRRGNLFSQALGYVGFGFVLGLLAGLVGGVEKGVLHLITGEPLPVPTGLWIGIALFFALASGLAYGVMLALVRGLGALLRTPSPEAVSSLFERFPRRSRWWGLLYTLIPGLGHFALGRPARGKPFLSAAVASGLSGLVIGIAGLILLVEGAVPTLPLLALGAALLLFPLVLVLVSALDLLFLRL